MTLPKTSGHLPARRQKLFQWNDKCESWVRIVEKEDETSGREVETVNAHSVLHVVGKEEGSMT